MSVRTIQFSVPEPGPAVHRRPMMSMEAVKGVLDRDDYGIISLVGTWLVSWDIAVPGVSRRERRILSRSVSLAAKFLNTSRRPHKWKWSEVLELIFPEASEAPSWQSGVEIQRLFNCSSRHVIRLVECEELKLVPGTTYGNGPDGSPLVTRESLVRFLGERLEDMRNVADFSNFSKVSNVSPKGILAALEEQSR